MTNYDHANQNIGQDAASKPDVHQLTLPGPMLQRGFWLYVWRVETPKGERLLLAVPVIVAAHMPPHPILLWVSTLGSQRPRTVSGVCLVKQVSNRSRALDTIWFRLGQYFQRSVRNQIKTETSRWQCTNQFAIRWPDWKRSCAMHWSQPDTFCRQPPNRQRKKIYDLRDNLNKTKASHARAKLEARLRGRIAQLNQIEAGNRD